MNSWKRLHRLDPGYEPWWKSAFADREIVQLELVAGDFGQARNFDFDGFPRLGDVPAFWSRHTS
jgi:hypothetical protein